MAKRVVLAYSGGLDTSVAVRWIQEEWGAEVVALAVDVGQTADDGDGTSIRERALAAGAVEAEVIDAARGVRRRLPRARDPRQRALRGQVPARVRAVAAGDRRAPRRIAAPRVRRRRGRATAAPARATTRCASRCRCARSRPISTCSRRCGCGASPATTASTTRPSTTSRSRRPRRSSYSIDENLVGPRHRVRRARGPVGRRRRPSLHAHRRRRRRAARAARDRGALRAGRAGRARRRARLPLARADRPARRRWSGAYGCGRIDMVENRRVGIKSREIYECPGSLALLLAHADLESITLERDLMREKARLEIRVRGAGLRRPLVLAAQGGARRVHGARPAARHRRGAAAPRAGPVLRRRAAAPIAGSTSYDLATYDAADTFRHEDSAGFVRLWGLRWRPGRAAQGPGAPMSADRMRPAAAVARPVRRGSGRRAARVHRSLLVRPPARARRPRRARARTSQMLARVGLLTDDESAR